MASIFLTQAELKTNLYTEVIDIITREDDDIVEEAIDAAIAEAKMYLTRYDLPALFGVEEDGDTPAVAPTVPDAMLKKLVKDIACWYILQLANAAVDMTVVRALYEDAIRKLKDIQKGMAAPINWPYFDTTTQPEPAEGDAVVKITTTKRNNYF